jgi:60 kDa SS-A/Ro ribonucleoprotein
MPNTRVFKTRSGPAVPPATTVNDAGGTAYARSSRDALTQYALTGTFNSTFYASAEQHLDRVRDLCAAVADPPFIADLAIYARSRGLMKDMPAALLAHLTSIGAHSDLARAWTPVIDSPRMLRTYVQLIRSGAFGRKSFGSAARRLIRLTLASYTPEGLFRASIGAAPSLVDVIKMAHPNLSASQSLVVQYLMGRAPSDPAPEGATADGKGLRSADGSEVATPSPWEGLPPIIAEFEAYKAQPSDSPPNVPWELLTGLPLTDAAWVEVARRSTWTQTRMNLNTFFRHNALGDPTLVEKLAARLENAELAANAKAMPYQLMAAWLSTSDDLPIRLRLALERAMDNAIASVPSFPEPVAVFLDVSGSMRSPITGRRGTATSKMTCVMVAALIAASIQRATPGTVVIPFDGRLHDPLTPKAGTPVTKIASTLAAYGGGATDVSLGLAHLVKTKASFPLVIYVSDNESWVDSLGRPGGYRSLYHPTATADLWAQYKALVPTARLACIDLTPNLSTQAPNSPDILNIGGFSDAVFDLLALFMEGASGLAIADRVAAAKDA